MGTRTVVKYHTLTKKSLEDLVAKGGKTSYRAKNELDKRAK